MHFKNNKKIIKNKIKTKKLSQIFKEGILCISLTKTVNTFMKYVYFLTGKWTLLSIFDM